MAAAHLFPGHAIDEPMEEDLAEVRSMRLKAWWSEEVHHRKGSKQMIIMDINGY